MTLPAQYGKVAELSTMAMRGFLVSGGREILAFQIDTGAMVAARFTTAGEAIKRIDPANKCKANYGKCIFCLRTPTTL